uniref:Cysteine-rich DPF motif domain-containing protein 1 n=1 Tax=Angiostrongylus cantonensis TaxID=6313 RepID=A0A0K0DHW0_ANGCA
KSVHVWERGRERIETFSFLTWHKRDLDLSNSLVKISTIISSIHENEIFPILLIMTCVGEEDVNKLEPYIQFQCSVCFLNEKCLFGDLKASDGFYPTPVFYMRDPFEPPRRVKGRKPLLSDFLVIGSSCSLCNQSVCLDKVAFSLDFQGFSFSASYIYLSGLQYVLRGYVLHYLCNT